MDTNLQEIPVKCRSGNNAVTVCADPDCTYSAPTCDQNDCQCKYTHEQCSVSSTPFKLKKLLESQGKIHSQILSHIYNWYQQITKLISIEMCEIQKLMDEQKLTLGGKSQILYNYLKKSQWNEIKSSLVSAVIESNSKQNKKQATTRQQMTHSLLLQKQKKIKEFFAEIKRVRNININTSAFTLKDMKFSQSNCHESLLVTNHHNVKVTAPTKQYVGAALSPSIIEGRYMTCKATFIIKKLKANQIMFGVAQLNLPQEIKFDSIHQYMNNGMLTPGGRDYYFGEKSGHKLQSSDLMVFQSNHVVQVEYEWENQKVIIRNVSNGTQCVFIIAVDYTIPLYFTVLLYSQFDEVELTAVESL